ncbi:hypothetical protein AA313_de0202093 [Arthrobotrys entomopaga]|nr:hypothetical protein AA313_de0202093 [Arthrobotrys entomopaga]
MEYPMALPTGQMDIDNNSNPVYIPRRIKRLVMDPETAGYFESVGLFGPPRGNIRTVHVYTTSPSLSQQPYEFIDLEQSVFRTPDDNTEEGIEVPINYESPESLEFVGFSPEKAAELWAIWDAIPLSRKSLRQFALGFVRRPPASYRDSFGAADDWEGSLDQLGVSTKLRDAIMSPGFESIRVTASCQYWVVDSMRYNWSRLRDLKRVFDENANYLRSINFKGKNIDELCSVLDLARLTE